MGLICLLPTFVTFSVMLLSVLALYLTVWGCRDEGFRGDWECRGPGLLVSRARLGDVGRGFKTGL